MNADARMVARLRRVLDLVYDGLLGPVCSDEPDRLLDEIEIGVEKLAEETASLWCERDELENTLADLEQVCRAAKDEVPGFRRWNAQREADCKVAA